MNKDAQKYAKELAFTLILGILMVRVQRAASKPDFGRTFLMGKAWGIKRFADYQVNLWADVAGKAATTYNRLKP